MKEQLTSEQFSHISIFYYKSNVTLLFLSHRLDGQHAEVTTRMHQIQQIWQTLLHILSSSLLKLFLS